MSLSDNKAIKAMTASFNEVASLDEIDSLDGRSQRHGRWDVQKLLRATDSCGLFILLECAIGVRNRDISFMSCFPACARGRRVRDLSSTITPAVLLLDLI